MGKINDKTGRKYGRLTVLEQLGVRNGRSMWYKCRCDCGKEKEISSENLRNDKYSVTSCGCAKRDCYKSLERSSKISEKLKKTNEYIFIDDYIIGITSSGKEFYFDKEDFEKVKNYNWNVQNSNYVTSNHSIIGKSGKHISIALQRLIMDFPKGKDVDHINHDQRDNRKSNLRVCTHQQNVFNTKAKGYYFDKRIKKWRVTIGLDYKTIHIGCFRTESEAKIAREQAAIKYFGEYRYREVV